MENEQEYNNMEKENLIELVIGPDGIVRTIDEITTYDFDKRYFGR